MAALALPGPGERRAENPAAAIAQQLPVDHLFTMRLQLSPYSVIPDGPHGSRVFCAILGGTAVGSRLNATVRPGGADWVTLRASGVSRLDVRLLLEADDGALILMEYGGIYNRAGASGPRSAPLFHASDPRYSWLNDVQAVGIGTPAEDAVTYEVYALR